MKRVNVCFAGRNACNFLKRSLSGFRAALVQTRHRRDFDKLACLDLPPPSAFFCKTQRVTAILSALCQARGRTLCRVRLSLTASISFVTCVCLRFAAAAIPQNNGQREQLPVAKCGANELWEWSLLPASW